jgi:predicted DCC family thiol-disulfide oxidoreductase YuxK
MQQTPSRIIFFDGVCNLCNGAVHFIIRKDKKNLFRFASLQSESARALLGDYYPDDGKFDTIIYFENDRRFTQSTAILRICRLLSFPWPMVYALIIIPPFVRDYIYSIISRNRYKWFGKKDQCMVPSAGIMHKFLND